MSVLEYRILRRVAAGGSGVVYLAVLMSDGRIVAVKRVPAAKIRKDALKEARTLASLDHPNIVKFYGVETPPTGELELVMEWVGPKLARLIDDGPVSPAVAVHVVRQLLDALDYLHGRGQLHCDLSPDNILLSAQGEAKLADFGLVKRVNTSRTTRGLRGTPPYISPEQIHGLKLDGRSDLFAVGVIFYELLAGAPPFDDSSDIGKNKPVTPIAVACPDLPTELVAMIPRFLAYDRTERFASARDARVALEAILAESVGRAPLVSQMRERKMLPDSKASIRWRSGRRLETMAALLLGAALGIGSWYGYRIQGASTTSSQPIDRVIRVIERQHERDADDEPTHRAQPQATPQQYGPFVLVNE